MRPSVIAIAILVACGAGAYAYMNDHLPPVVSDRIDAALAQVAVLRGGDASRPAGTGAPGGQPPAGQASTGQAPAGQAPVGGPPAAAAGGAPAAGGRPGGRGPTPVEVAQAESAEPLEEIRSVGNLLADESVQIAPEQAGRVAAIRFEEGQAVAEGEELVKLDDTLLAAEAQEVQARAELAQANYDRASSLSRTGSGTQRTLDEALADRLTSNALLLLIESRLEKTSIKAPFPGIMGLRSVSVGAYVEPGRNIATLDKIDIVKVEFTIPERNLTDVRVGYAVEVRVDAYPDRVFRGEIYAIDPQVDVNGRSLKVRARLPNPDLSLRPGLFARVVVQGASRGEVVLVPEGAIVPRGGESFVYKVSDGKVEEAKVELGRRRAGLVELTTGIAAGDTVVVAGHARLRNGAPVEIVVRQTDAASGG
ncbi:efflux RND transporter periplasmic adaptor subunit [Pseudoxanthobacter sp. M-2]|uniref:efflux RND transporter periplasmic adaptor subunit n=1 Tax=Pseudoxanthobacter sp. M-2 TaxID=3078754 RepID=UPI0038FC5981